MLSAVNRVLVGLAGLVLLALGTAVLAGRPHGVLLSTADRHKWRAHGWWWPTVIAVLSVLVLLALWWLLAQLHRRRLREVVVDCGDGGTAVVRGRALEAVLEAEAGALDGVDRARVTLTGHRTAPGARITLILAPHATPVTALQRLHEAVLAPARTSTGLTDFRAEIRLRVVRHRAERVE
ncbi:alkaline shock response membrane anchor protein AmaP [Streptoverticillium reticulum]|uniref:alkaline shock response membrane anchor protein AmaP n=1 Tax=Streptoverticillium reticulum TaxID=1433415 RepID=UPI0039BF00C9